MTGLRYRSLASATGMALLLSAPSQAHERPAVTCPKTVSVPQAGFTPPAGWQVWPMPKTQLLDDGELLEGQTEKPPFVQLQDLDFQPEGNQPYSVSCSYNDTALHLIHKLPVSARSCRMYDPLDGNDAPSFEKKPPTAAAPRRFVCW